MRLDERAGASSSWSRHNVRRLLPRLKRPTGLSSTLTSAYPVPSLFSVYIDQVFIMASKAAYKRVNTLAFLDEIIPAYAPVALKGVCYHATRAAALRMGRPG